MPELQIAYPPELPVTQRREVYRGRHPRPPGGDRRGETGSGKTTQLPKICLELGRGRRTGSGGRIIGHTQPRRIAARSVAERIASELGTELGTWSATRCGSPIGRRGRAGSNDDRRHPAGRAQRDRQLPAYDTIIIDEAHERSLNIDFLLGYLKRLLPKRPDL